MAPAHGTYSILPVAVYPHIIALHGAFSFIQVAEQVKVQLIVAVNPVHERQVGISKPEMERITVKLEHVTVKQVYE